MPTNYPYGRLGANYLGDGSSSFLVWAPAAQEVSLCLLQPEARQVPLEPIPGGYFRAIVDVEPGATYQYRLNGGMPLPDPVSRFQVESVHSASQICDPGFRWEDDNWFGLPLRDYILYELHVGTFTPEGTFDAVIPHLEYLADLGITAIELMPVAQFPGSRNWGYDGVLPFAVQNSYGGPGGLKRLVNACHQAGLAVVLDVVYNHLGPEGNYLSQFGPYFSDRHVTPWGAAFNFDGAFSNEVRRYFIENALYWQTDFHIDALRLDAIHAIRDFSATPFLQTLARAVHRQSEKLNRRCYLIGESDLNDARYITSERLGGIGLDAQWSDDFHHCLHTLLTGEKTGYYADYGSIELFAKTWREGYAYTGQFSPYRKRYHGNSPRLNSSRQFVVFSQNHDQIGNRLAGDRLTRLADLEALKLAAGAVLLSPFIPLLFMGEEYGEAAPFQYVVSHTDPELVEAVRRGRREEFAEFRWQGEVPDPFAEETFRKCILTRETCRDVKPHSVLHTFYQELIRLRRHLPALVEADKASMQVDTIIPGDTLRITYPYHMGDALLFLCFSPEPVLIPKSAPRGTWRRLLDSADPGWEGPGSAAPELFHHGDDIKLSPKSVLFLLQTSKD